MTKLVREGGSSFRYVLWLIVVTISCFFLATIYLWPKKPHFVLKTIIPDPENPFEISDESAWTNWKAVFSVSNSNMYPLWSKEAELHLYFSDRENKLAAIAKIGDVHIKGNGESVLNVSLKIPLYSDGDQENLIGKCMSQSEVNVEINASAVVGIFSNIDVVIRGTFEEILSCGNISKTEAMTA